MARSQHGPIYTNGRFHDRKAKAVWRGTGRRGQLSTDSGVLLAETLYSFRIHFENAKATNPEELIAAAQARCFTMAAAFQLPAGVFRPRKYSANSPCIVGI